MNKFRLHFSVIIILSIITLPQLHAQFIMQVDPALQAGVGPMQVKQKGVKAVPYYYFDEFRVVSSKTGWMTTRTRSNFQGEISASSQQLAFQIVNGAGDTTTVNMEKNGLVQSQQNAWFPSITMSQGSQNVTSLISSGTDTLTWGMAVTLANGVFTGAVKTDTEEFKILPVSRMDNGKTAPFTLWVGFEIYRNNKAIGAMQATPKRNIWLLPDLPADEKLKLAATCISLMIMEQQEWLME